MLERRKKKPSQHRFLRDYPAIFQFIVVIVDIVVVIVLFVKFLFASQYLQSTKYMLYANIFSMFLTMVSLNMRHTILKKKNKQKTNDQWYCQILSTIALHLVLAEL